MRPATVQGMRALALWAVLFAAYAATLGINAVGRARLRRRRAALPAGRRVDRLRRRHRPHGRVRDARLRGLPPRRAAPAGPGGPRPQRRAAGHRLRAADRAGVRARRGERGRGLPRRDRGARLRARRGDRAADGAGAVGERRGAARRALTARAGARDRRLSRGRGGDGARRRRAVRAAGARAAGARQRGRRRGAARRAAVAGAEVPAPGGADRDRARALDGAPRPPHRRARGGRGDGGLDRRLRDDQRPPVRRPDPLRRVGLRATARPARTRSPSTSSGCRAWPRCGSTATSACCAGRPCSR